MTAAISLTATACGGLTGSALNNNANGQLGLAPIRPDTEIGVLGTLLYNDSHTAITIDSVALSGTGLGTVVRPVQTKIADGSRHSTVPSSVYAEDPPVTRTTGGCVVQTLRQVSGYRLRPGQVIAVWTIIIGIRPGRFSLSTHVVTYTENGRHYQESITQGFHGIVSRHAATLTTAGDNSGGCWRRSGHLLKGVPW